jgi:hypothetical protein
VPDFLSYFLISGGAFLSLLLAIYNGNLSNLVYFPASVAVLFGFAYLMYFLGQWGGGDVKLMLGLAFVFTALNIYSNFSFVAVFINTLVFGGVYGLLGTITFGLLKFKLLKKYLRSYDIGIIIIGVAAIASFLLYLPSPISYLSAFAAFLFVSMRYIYLVAENLMYVEVPVAKLTEGDWLVNDVKDEKGSIIVERRNTGLIPEDLEKLSHSKIKRVLVKIGLPFVPGVLLGVLITLIFGNPLLQIISSTIVI